MRKFVNAFLMIFAVLLIACDVSAEEQKEILFRNLPWGSSYTQAKQTITDWKWNDYAGENHGADTVKDVVGIGEDIDTTNYNLNLYAYPSSSNKIVVAGYQTTETRLYFVYTPRNDAIDRSEDNTALYLASYKFEPADLEGVFNDLQGKLISLYGEPSEVTHDTNWTNDKYTYVTWKGPTSYVVLKMDDERESTWATGNYIYIFYVWDNATDALKLADETVTAMDMANEATHFGNDDVSGL